MYGAHGMKRADIHDFSMFILLRNSDIFKYIYALIRCVFILYYQ